MKKNIITSLGACLIAGCLMSSCNKFLEEQVDNRTLITTIPDMEKTLNTLLPYSDHHFTDLMTDDYIFRDVSGHVVETATAQVLPIFELAITRESLSASLFLSGGFNPVTAFRRYYYRIINSFLIIERANALKPATAEEAARIKIIVGKAKAIKAYCNYMLVKLFAKQYNPATAKNDVGIPFVDKYNAEAIVPYEKVSVQNVYDSVETDLLSALTMVEETEKTNAPFTLGKDGILALLSRFYLDKKDWDNCIKYSDLLLAKRSDVLKVKQLRFGISDYEEYSNQYFNPANASYVLMGNNTYQLLAYFYSGMYPYPIVDVLRDNNADSTNNFIIQTSALFRDYVPQKFGKFFSTSTRNFNLPLLTVDEVYFNRAEASIEKNNGITTQAKNDLILLVNNQTFTTAETNAKLAQLNTLTGRTSAINYLLLIKRIRFTGEGMRWFDIKRHNLPVSHTGRSGTYSITGSNPEAYVIKLPLEEITRNSGAE